MKFIAILMLVFGSLRVVGQDSGVRLDGNELLPTCKSAVRLMDKVEHSNADNMYSLGYCSGLVTGVSDMLDLCGAQTYGQQIRIVVKFFDDHPEKLNLRATSLVKQALLGTSGCKK